jgi:hypothetical protein
VIVAWQACGLQISVKSFEKMPRGRSVLMLVAARLRPSALPVVAREAQASMRGGVTFPRSEPGATVGLGPAARAYAKLPLGESMKPCPRAGRRLRFGRGKSARPVRRAGGENGARHVAIQPQTGKPCPRVCRSLPRRVTPRLYCTSFSPLLHTRILYFKKWHILLNHFYAFFCDIRNTEIYFS